jgi:hypothetical protein
MVASEAIVKASAPIAKMLANQIAERVFNKIKTNTYRRDIRTTTHEVFSDFEQQGSSNILGAIYGNRRFTERLFQLERNESVNVEELVDYGCRSEIGETTLVKRETLIQALKLFADKLLEAWIAISPKAGDAPLVFVEFSRQIDVLYILTMQAPQDRQADRFILSINQDSRYSYFFVPETDSVNRYQTLRPGGNSYNNLSFSEFCFDFAIDASRASIERVEAFSYHYDPHGSELVELREPQQVTSVYFNNMPHTYGEIESFKKRHRAFEKIDLQNQSRAILVPKVGIHERSLGSGTNRLLSVILCLRVNVSWVWLKCLIPKYCSPRKAAILDYSVGDHCSGKNLQRWADADQKKRETNEMTGGLARVAIPASSL